ncbi:glycoside hydrolase [Streptomyces sp. NPDC059373]
MPYTSPLPGKPARRWSPDRWSPRRLRLLALAALPLVASALTAGPLAAEAQAATSAAALVTTQAQTVDGFGASGAWWVNDLAGFSSTAKSQVGNLLFDASGLDLSIYRYNIGGGGTGVTNPTRAPQTLQTSVGSYDWTRDPGGSYFLQSASDHGVPTLIGFVNSAPKAWTSNAQSCGGTLVSGTESAYATYLADITAHWASNGVTLDYLSPMNEPDSSFSDCGQEGMAVPVSQRAALIKALGSTLASRSLTSTGIIADETSQTSSFVTNTPTWMNDSTAAGYVSALAHHTYDFPGDTALRKVAAVGSTYNKPLWASEICCQKSGTSGWGQQYDPTIDGGLDLANYVYRDFTLANDRSFQWWTALSSVIGCDVGTDSSCAGKVNTSGWNDGLIYYDPSYATDGNQSLYMTKRYYALAQYSKYVRPGAVRYDISGAPAGVQTMAFWKDGAWTVVASNTNSAASSLTLDTNSGALTPTATHRTSATESLASVTNPTISGSVLTASLPARSVTTFQLASAGAPGSGARTSTSTLVGAQSGKCLEDPSYSTTNGTVVDIYTCNGGTNQNWTLTAAGELRGYGNKCLDAYSQGTGNGTVVDIYTCNGGANQKWTVTDGGSVVGRQSGLCLDVTGQATANGSPLELYACNGGANQKWTRG